MGFDIPDFLFYVRINGKIDNHVFNFEWNTHRVTVMSLKFKFVNFCRLLGIIS